jgi:hypothetical protein
VSERSGTKRALRSLRRASEHKSIPDLVGIDIAKKRGWLRILGHDDDPQNIERGELRIDITDAGRAALATPITKPGDTP